jgi:hypothetical protein
VLRMTTIPGDNRETESVLDRFSFWSRHK